MRVLTVVGTRPNFTKELSIARALKSEGIDEILVHTGQHYDYEMSQTFFDGLELPKPQYLNSIVKSGFHGDETATMLSFIEQVLLQEKPDVTLVYGDVNSSVAAALASVKLRIPVAHIEAGLRCEHFYNAEEINRKVTDVVSELLFPHIHSAYDSLIKEGYPQKSVILPGDVVMDSQRIVTQAKDIRTSDQGYILMTVHRSENTDSPKRMESILQGVKNSEKPVLFLMHPRTRSKLIEYGLLNTITRSNIEILAPAGFVDFLKLLAAASMVVTDSGGVRREAYIYKKPVVNTSEFIWVPEMVEAGWSLPVGYDARRITEAIKFFQPPEQHPAIFGDGHAAERIATELKKRYS
ncbi:MAG: UDP-N-acetylglucosamine 2-epimerase (non-hydrolyzing) [Deltaproteobacteria bacterium]|nr:UDP-N-acetylglucosamine 2-epimerase (non-hydrolyzing) [Deltaproteobacteria bacterium]